MALKTMATTMHDNNNIAIDIREAGIGDGVAVVALDAEITGTDKATYWADILQRYAGKQKRLQRHFLVATSAESGLVGFIVGEIRAWEFGSPPCGWVLALSVSPGQRQQGIGSLLLDALCAKFKGAKVTTIRTMVLGSDKVNLSFFRGEGLAAGPYIELEKRLD